MSSHAQKLTSSDAPIIPESNMAALPKIAGGNIGDSKISSIMSELIDEEEFNALKEIQADNTNRDVRFKTNEHYTAIAAGKEYKSPDGKVLVPKMPPSKAAGKIISPRLSSFTDMSGEADPSSQLSYSPEGDGLHGGVLHKYDETVLILAAPGCAGMCAHCYRNDFIDGASLTGKFVAKPEALKNYIIEQNKKVADNNSIDPETGEKILPIREALISGGDPLTLSNRRIFEYLDAIGSANVQIARIGTRELSFMPERIDDAFIETLSIVRKKYPDMRINFVIHYSHPDEFLFRDENGNYVENDSGTGFKWMNESTRALEALKSLSFVTIQNQTPIISGVNDDPKVLHILHQELNRCSVKPKYIFQNRTILGYKAFSIPLEEAWWIHKKAMEGLSDDGRSRIAMSTKRGKLEIISVTGLENKTTRPDSTSKSNGLVILKKHRAPNVEELGGVIILKSNPQALWLDDYTEEDVIHDQRIGEENCPDIAKLID
ncbi:MAG: hypothetical protein KAJ40_02705 [Alphaproteobacteria bacterium]|nr:hypothetical protein [Alphaproteobacteria bacterium]